MSDADQIIPSWEDAADRWMKAYFAMKAERDELAERVLLDDDEREAVRRWLNAPGTHHVLDPILRRLLPDEVTP
jgi:hypothetical protein